MRRKSFREFVDHSRDKVWFSFLLNFAVMLLMLLCMKPYYETNDDTTMMTFINGARGEGDIRLVFEHFLLGIVYKLLYSLPGNLPWYTIFQYAVLLMSFTAVTYVVLRKLKGPAGFCVAALLLGYFGFECYISMQFTKTASVAVCAGVLLLFYAVGSGERISWKASVCGLLLGSIGPMYRMKQSVACTALMTGIGVYVILKLLRENRKNVLRGLLPYLKVFGAFALCILLLEVSDRMIYRMDDQWAEYVRYNDLRSDLFDYYGVPKYEENKELYDELGISKSAYRLYLSWNFYDPDKFTPEVIQRLIDQQPEHRLSLALVKSFLKEFPLNFFQSSTFYCFMLLAVLWLFCGYHRREDILAVLYEIFLFGALYLYLYFSGKYGINRVDAGLWFALSLVSVWFLDAERMKISWKMAGAVCLAVLVLVQGDWKSYWRVYHTGDEEGRKPVRDVIDEIRQDKEHLYFVKIGLVSDYEAYGIFDPMPEGFLDNKCLLGGWDCNIPAVQDIMASFGISNPYRDMIDNPDIYIVDDNIDLTLDYLREYYAPDAQAILKKEVNDRKIYQIVTEG